MNKKKSFTLFLIFFFSLIIRIFNARYKAFFYPDEGTYALEAIWLLEGEKAINKTWSYVEFNFNGRGAPFTSLKPLHNILTALFFKIFGISDLSAYLYVSFFGSLSVVLVYLIAKEYINKPMYPTIFMAFFGAHVYYSTTLLTEVVYIFFLLLSLYLYLKRFYYHLGIVLGLAFGIRYSGIVLLFIYLILIRNKNFVKVLLGFSLVLILYFYLYRLFNLDYLYFLIQRASFSPFIRKIFDIFGIEYSYLDVKMMNPFTVLLALTVYSLMSYPIVYVLGLYKLKEFKDIEKFTLLYILLLFIVENDINRAFILISPMLSILAFKNQKFSIAILILSVLFSIPTLFFKQTCYKDVSEVLNTDSKIFSDNCNILYFYTGSCYSFKYNKDLRGYLVLSDEIERLSNKKYNVDCQLLYKFKINTEPWKLHRTNKYLRVYLCK